ncbi:MAG: BON domain-containing protein [Paludibacterium sp.]|uniref:BON domain-containing protein n=1 Tax=Paludibacterium sp. TaxID=1917523 RepID=UPI0025E97321|nr:BON domain-containing protein [Paludibacterium sp.]MBV8047599.1 BON domain-containing protein [Paludibacterium sp.]MBV8648217.1 BON domain-containing protein [Paludibacterium sp.]
MKKLFSALGLAVAMGFSVSGCTVTSGQSTVGQYVDDATVTARVKKRLATEPKVSAMRISVETLKGVVELSGFAVSEAEKMRAGEIARSVPGVKDVRNHIIVQPPQQ